ncbi:hypothetical protein DK842_12740 [Chromobacterium phragmitis]|uniref:Uncharacterized protein n=1 Tax=Chromobacterium phragmitis TaxID=2202141 RepID=A0A344ULA7_9NEIS|nr:hypothetical protein [Chromobacterium phragmitis]AXE30684.1 hypothetical protein DK842_12740 [Chromobacterium phragmitis]AXE36055.1 hypothetical protein DK843_18170 [Chromobacterium phragmitis]
MKHVMTAAMLIAASLTSLPSQAGVSISVGEPGFYGQIDIGGYPPPQLIYPQPVVIQPAVAVMPPLYLRVPPGHIKQWGRYCGRYGACGRKVYFVRDDWYNRVYAPRYREYHHDHGRHEGWDHGRGHGDDWRRDR